MADTYLILLLLFKQFYDKITVVIEASKQTPSPEKPSFIQPTDPTEIDRMTPNVTYDSALGHMVDNFSEINMDQLREFYYTLPHENKPDLDKLRIHFSAGHLKEDYKNTGVNVSYGQFYPYGLKSMEQKRQDVLPDIADTMPTISVFVGSMLIEEQKKNRFRFATQARSDQPFRKMESEKKGIRARVKAILGRLGVKRQEQLQPHLSEVNTHLRQTLSHELVHFAQMDADQVGATGQEFDPSVTDRARNLGHAALTYLQEIKASIATGVATSGGLMGVTRMVGEGFLSADIPPTMAAGFGVAAAALYQKTRAPKQYPEKHEEYLAIDIEQDARHHQNPELDLVGVVPKDTVTLPAGYSPKSFVKDLNPRPLAPLKRRLANNQHARLATTPVRRQ